MLIMALTGSITSCTSPQPEDQKGLAAQLQADEAAARRLLADWTRAYLTRDTATLRKVISEEWLYSGSSNRTVTKDEVISGFVKSPDRYEAIDFQDLKVRVYGNTAVLTSAENMRVRRSDSSRVTYRLRFTDVYVKESGAWKAVATHTSPAEGH